MYRPIYNRKGWVLCQCLTCGRLNYVEPHGTTAKCRCSSEWQEHRNIPYQYRDMTGTACLQHPPKPDEADRV